MTLFKIRLRGHAVYLCFHKICNLSKEIQRALKSDLDFIVYVLKKTNRFIIRVVVISEGCTLPFNQRQLGQG